MQLFQINQSEDSSKITIKFNNTCDQLHQRSVTSAINYNRTYSTYTLIHFIPGDDCDSNSMCDDKEECIEKKCRPKTETLECKCGIENNNLRNFNRIIKGSRVTKV